MIRQFRKLARRSAEWTCSLGGSWSQGRGTSNSYPMRDDIYDCAKQTRHSLTQYFGSKTFVDARYRDGKKVQVFASFEYCGLLVVLPMHVGFVADKAGLFRAVLQDGVMTYNGLRGSMACINNLADSSAQVGASSSPPQLSSTSNTSTGRTNNYDIDNVRLLLKHASLAGFHVKIQWDIKMQSGVTGCLPDPAESTVFGCYLLATQDRTECKYEVLCSFESPVGDIALHQTIALGIERLRSHSSPLGDDVRAVDAHLWDASTRMRLLGVRASTLRVSPATSPDCDKMLQAAVEGAPLIVCSACVVDEFGNQTPVRCIGMDAQKSQIFKCLASKALSCAPDQPSMSYLQRLRWIVDAAVGEPTVCVPVADQLELRCQNRGLKGSLLLSVSRKGIGYFRAVEQLLLLFLADREAKWRDAVDPPERIFLRPDCPIEALETALRAVVHPLSSCWHTVEVKGKVDEQRTFVVSVFAYDGDFVERQLSKAVDVNRHESLRRAYVIAFAANFPTYYEIMVTKQQFALPKGLFRKLKGSAPAGDEVQGIKPAAPQPAGTSCPPSNASLLQALQRGAANRHPTGKLDFSCLFVSNMWKASAKISFPKDSTKSAIDLGFGMDTKKNVALQQMFASALPKLESSLLPQQMDANPTRELMTDQEVRSAVAQGPSSPDIGAGLRDRRSVIGCYSAAIEVALAAGNRKTLDYELALSGKHVRLFDSRDGGTSTAQLDVGQGERMLQSLFGALSSMALKMASRRRHMLELAVARKQVPEYSFDRSSLADDVEALVLHLYGVSIETSVWHEPIGDEAERTVEVFARLPIEEVRCLPPDFPWSSSITLVSRTDTVDASLAEDVIGAMNDVRHMLLRDFGNYFAPVVRVGTCLPTVIRDECWEKHPDGVEMTVSSVFGDGDEPTPDSSQLVVVAFVNPQSGEVVVEAMGPLLEAVLECCQKIAPCSYALFARTLLLRRAPGPLEMLSEALFFGELIIGRPVSCHSAIIDERAAPVHEGLLLTELFGTRELARGRGSRKFVSEVAAATSAIAMVRDYLSRSTRTNVSSLLPPQNKGVKTLGSLATAGLPPQLPPARQ